MFDGLLESGVIRPSSSPSPSPLVIVKKKTGDLRPCVDYRALNAVSVPDNYNLPRIDDIIPKIRASIFSVIDLKDAFYQIPIQKQDIYKTAVFTPFGNFEYTRLPLD